MADQDFVAGESVELFFVRPVDFQRSRFRHFAQDAGDGRMKLFSPGLVFGFVGGLPGLQRFHRVSKLLIALGDGEWFLGGVTFCCGRRSDADAGEQGDEQATGECLHEEFTVIQKQEVRYGFRDSITGESWTKIKGAGCERGSSWIYINHEMHEKFVCAVDRRE